MERSCNQPMWRTLKLVERAGSPIAFALRALSFIFFVTLLSGCQGGLKLPELGLDKLFAAKPQKVALKDAPLDAKLVASAMLMRLQGKSPAEIASAISVYNAKVFLAVKAGALRNWSAQGLYLGIIYVFTQAGA